ncbi:MAG: hypothetical protein IIY87_04815, partial [Bacteroidales bacterium]|nr:hypothetical protein [Bacteroidales bacterium]
MKELILIHGTTLEKAKKALKEAARWMNNNDISITSVQLFTTRDDNTFAVRPNRMCEPWDFSILCDTLLSEFDNDKDAYLEGLARKADICDARKQEKSAGHSDQHIEDVADVHDYGPQSIC